MTQQLVGALVVILTGITATSFLFGLLLLTSLALNKIFPNTQAEDQTEKKSAEPLNIPTQMDEETVAVIQAAITAHLRRSTQ